MSGSGFSSSYGSVLCYVSLFALMAGGLLATVRAAEVPSITSGLEFSNSPGRVTLDSGFSLAGRSFTVESWIWLNSAGGDRPVLAQVGGGDLLHLLVRNNRLHLGFFADDLAGTAAVPHNEWVHVAYTYDEATRQQSVFLNGVLDGSRVADASFAENNLPLHIGAYVDFSGNPFDGRMLELRVWDHARSEGQIAAGRFATPAVNAPGLEALFTFEGIAGDAVPEATGSLTGNQAHGAVAAVAPVLPPALLAPDAPVAFAVPAGSLDFALSGYAVDPAASASYPDIGGGQLSDGLIPYRVWGTPWLDFSGARTAPLVAWENASPEITFSFTERVRLDAITLYAANSGGTAGVALPQSVQVRSPGGFSASFPVVPGSDVGAMQAIVLDSLGIFTEAVTITLDSAGDWIALAEVSFDGAALADPALQAQDGGLSLPAKRFLGLAPDAMDASTIQLEVVHEAAEARFEFPRAADDFGVQAVVEWSTDLIHWEPLPYQPSTEPGREFARLAPPPAEGRAFFRIVFPDGPPTAAAPGSVSAMESDGPLAFHPLGVPGAIETPLDPASLQLLAINDQPLDAFAGPIATPSGGTLEILPDGTITYAANPGLAEGQVAEETFTYTVSDRFGRSVRNTFTLSVVGENDPPSVGSFAGTHASGVVDAGVAYRYFTGSFATEAAFDTATPVRTGRIPTLALDPADFDGSGGALEITGELFVSASGPYTFYLTGNHGSVLDIGGTRVVDYDAAAHTPTRSGTIELSAGSHPIRVRYFDAAFTEGEAALALEFSGPGFVREAIPANVFPRLSDLPIAVASDPDDGDALRISHLNGVPVPEGEEAVLPSGATLLLADSGQITYRPAPGSTILHEAVDTETFTFTVSDGGGLSATGTAEIELSRMNIAPVANADYIFTLAKECLAHVLAVEVAEDADEDLLRITHVNGQAIVGGATLTLPSTARVSLSTFALTSGNPQQATPLPFGLRYDAIGSFVKTLDQQTATDAFTLTVTDPAGAAIDIEIGATWFPSENLIEYRDSRFDGSLGPRTARIYSFYRFPVDVVVSVSDRQTGLRYGQSNRTLGSGQLAYFDFDLPDGIDLEEAHFFDRFDFEIDTPEGVPVFYGNNSGLVTLAALYSSATDSFFQLSGAISPHWPFRVETNRGTTFYGSGFRRFATNYGGFAQVFRLDVLARGASGNIVDIEPTFAANITVQGVCRSRDRSRFTIQNLNPEPVPFRVGSTQQVFTVGAGQTQTIEVPYESKVPVFILDTPLGQFDSNEVTCPQTFDFTATSLCADPLQSFTQVRNNDPDNSYTVRVESVLYPSIRSEPVTVGNQGDVLIPMEYQNVNLGGTEGRLIIILPNREEIGPTFTFSNTPCS